MTSRITWTIVAAAVAGGLLLLARLAGAPELDASTPGIGEPPGTTLNEGSASERPAEPRREGTPPGIAPLLGATEIDGTPGSAPGATGVASPAAAAANGTELETVPSESSPGAIAAGELVAVPASPTHAGGVLLERVAEPRLGPAVALPERGSQPGQPGDSGAATELVELGPSVQGATSTR